MNLGLPTGPRLKIMGHFGILRADGSSTSNHYRQAPPSPSSSLHRGGGEVNSPSSSHDDALYGLQNEVARLAEVVEALQRSNNGISDALNRVEMENAELRSGHRELLERQARLAKRHSKLHASVFSRKPTDKEEVDEEAYFETGRYEIDDDDEDEEESSPSAAPRSNSSITFCRSSRLSFPSRSLAAFSCAHSSSRACTVVPRP